MSISCRRCFSETPVYCGPACFQCRSPVGRSGLLSFYAWSGHWTWQF